MGEKAKYTIPKPIVNSKEQKKLERLTERYNKLLEPNPVAKAGKKASDVVGKVVPEVVKEKGKNVKQAITEAELFEQCMKIVGDGFQVLEKNAAKATISEKTIIKKVNNSIVDNEVEKLEEVCLAREYDLSRIVNGYKKKDLGLATVEGGVTGFFGFAGLPFNLVLSTFIFYRAVQSVAMMYGYDVKNNPEELIIASDVFMNALSPTSKGLNEITSIIGKIMVMAEATVVKQTVKKTWQEMAEHGGVCLLIVQMRALANKAAKKALEKAGEKGLEHSLFKSIFENIAKKMTKKAVGKAIPFVGAIIGSLFDVSQMNKVIEYADIFYNKRFILEKEARIYDLIDDSIIVESNNDIIVIDE